MERKEAYKWLASHLGIDGKDCHIGMFSEEQCKEVQQVLRRKRVSEYHPEEI